MLGLPDGITACLFDLDGVLTDTAAVHERAWKQIFDAFLGARGTFESADYNRYVDGKPREDGIRDFLASRDIRPERRARSHGSASTKNDLVLQLIHDEGVKRYEGSARYLQAAKDAGLRRALVSSSHNAEEVLDVTGLTDLIEERVDGHVKDELRPARQARAGHVPGGGADGSACAPEQAAVFEDAPVGRRRRARREVRPCDRRRPRRPARGAARARRGRRRRRPRRAPLSFAVEPWSVTEDVLDLDALARSESVFALSNGHIGLRGNLDEGEPFGLPGHLPQRLLRDAPAAVRRGRLRLPGGRPDRRQRHQRQADPAAGRRRAVRHPLRRAAQAHAHARPARRPAAPRGALALAERARGRGQDARGSSPSRSARWRRSATRSARSTAARCGSWRCPSWWPTSPTPERSEDPRAASALRAPLVAEEQEVHDLRVVLVHRTSQSGLRMAAGIDHVIEDARRA